MTSSFRDPSGFVFSHKGEIYRQINQCAQKDYELLFSSGLYEKLTTNHSLITHTEIPKSAKIPLETPGWKIIAPRRIPFISYYYEWAFGMLKDAALLTLHIQKTAIEHGMSLKDASAFNIQFMNGKPILIDTLSFEKYEEGKPWVAYKQFVEQFLSPLALASFLDIRLNRITSVFLDGIPVDLTSQLLPFKSKLNISLLIHIHAHAANQKKFSNKNLDKKMQSKKFSKIALLGLVDNLEKTVKKLSWNPKGTQWAEYYEEDNNNYSSESFTHKKNIVKDYLQKVKSQVVWDIGANTGIFSDIAAQSGAQVISFDADEGALEKHYQQLKTTNQDSILPLFCDLTNPTPSLGWMNEERLSLFQREKADTVMALALIHHLCISKNLPFSYLADCFAAMGNFLIIEFIEKNDSQIQILLANRKDIFSHYTQKEFEDAFGKQFTIIKKTPITESKRTLYLMKQKQA